MRWHWVSGGVALCAVAGIVVHLALRGPETPPPTPLRLKMAVAATPQNALLDIATANQYFERRGIDLSMVNAADGEEAVRFLLSGVADIAAAPEVPFVVAVLNGAPLQLATSILNMPAGNAIVALRSHHIESARDLVGKRIGVAWGTSADYFLWAYLARHRVSGSRVDLVGVEAARSTGALLSGGIDAVVAWPPMVFELEGMLRDDAVVLYGPEAYVETQLLVGRADYLEGNRETLHRILRALLDAEDFARRHPEEAQAIVARSQGIARERLRQWWRGSAFTVEIPQSSLLLLEDVARWAAVRGHAGARPAPNFLDSLHTDALEDLRPDRVTVIR